MSGRKPRYETHVLARFTEIERWAKNGATERQIAKNLGIAYSTLNQYKVDHPELVELIKKARLDVVMEVRGALIRRALGYGYDETKEVTERVKWPDGMYSKLIDAGFTPEELGEARVVKTEVAHKQMAPDVAAANLVLKNYDKNNWANDPQMLEIRKKELKLREKQIENNSW